MLAEIYNILHKDSNNGVKVSKRLSEIIALVEINVIVLENFKIEKILRRIYKILA